VSRNWLTSVDTCEDFICYGTDVGGVGVMLEGRSVTLRPHNFSVTRTIFMDKNSGLRILSAALDGTVRMIDLGHQTVGLEYSWDQSYCGRKAGVNWLEKRGVYSFLLDCGVEINQVDIRAKEAVNLFKLNDEDPAVGRIAKLSVHPISKHMISLCRGDTVQIWDLRMVREPVHRLTGPTVNHMAGGGWSVNGKYFVTCQSRVEGDVPVVYSSLDLSRPVLTWEGSRRQVTFCPFIGTIWSPWDESILHAVSTQPRLKRKDGITINPEKSIVAINCDSGEVAGEVGAELGTSSLVHCHKSRQMIVVGNSNEQGGIGVFRHRRES